MAVLRAEANWSRKEYLMKQLLLLVFLPANQIPPFMPEIYACKSLHKSVMSFCHENPLSVSCFEYLFAVFRRTFLKTSSNAI